VKFRILSYRGTIEEDREITSLLNHVYVKEGYTDKSYAEKIFVPAELRKRGEIILTRSIAGKLLGMAIFVPSSSPARQIAELGEAEIHLLAVYPEVRCHGIASCLIKACEEQAISFGYSKLVLSTQRTMKEAHRIYDRLGYRRKSTRDWSTGENKIYFVYEKILRT